MVFFTRLHCRGVFRPTWIGKYVAAKWPTPSKYWPFASWAYSVWARDIPSPGLILGGCRSLPTLFNPGTDPGLLMSCPGCEPHTMSTTMFILVFVGDPLDCPEYRHTALFFEFPNGSASAMHVEGGHGFFEFQALDNYHPEQEQSRQLARKIDVATLDPSVEEASIRGVISRTLAKNGPMDADWNCQSWVADALARMVKNRLLDQSQRAFAIDRMTDVCLEAADV